MLPENAPQLREKLNISNANAVKGRTVLLRNHVFVCEIETNESNRSLSRPELFYTLHQMQTKKYFRLSL